jgi:hypothetical protein
MSRRFDGRDAGAQSTPAQIVAPAEATGDEASALAAMFAQTSQQWEQTQEQMARLVLLLPHSLSSQKCIGEKALRNLNLLYSTFLSFSVRVCNSYDPFLSCRPYNP